MDNLLIGACTADLHFSAFNPKEQYEILKNQFIDVISNLPRLDYIAVAGDIYDHKLMGNSDGLYYASLIIDEIVRIAKEKNSTVLLLHGTFSHDSDQLKNFYHYLNSPDLDIRIVTNIQFEMIKGARVLCIPELYGIEESVYDKYLHKSGYYDIAIMHGTFEGAVYGNTVGNGRLFTIHDFDMCRGFMIGGHVHTPGCFKGYFYYTGSPYRWKFGEEEKKGYLIATYDKDTYLHYVHFQEIISKTYITIDITTIENNNPTAIINYINELKVKDNIDFLKVKFKVPINGSDKVIISNYFRNNNYTFVEFLDAANEYKIKTKEKEEFLSEYDFILDNSISDIEKFVKYVNIREGKEFITVDKLTEILNEVI